MQQIVSFEAETERTEHVVYKGLNALLPRDIGCVFAQKMPSGFRARNASKRKLYRYRVLNQDIADPLRLGRVWWVRERIDVGLVEKELSSFIGTHEFSSFRATRCTSKTTIRTLESFRCVQEGKELIFEVIGKGFLRHQVRIMVGTLVDLGRGSLKNTSISMLLQQKDRRGAGMTAPAHGLYLVWTSLLVGENT
jgi:tRNA pseudouridine38-40 synthase